MSQRVTPRIGSPPGQAQAAKAEPFQTALRNAITKGLSDVLGDAGAQATSFHLGLKPTSTPAVVHDGLVRMFGTGAQSLELSILRELYRALGLTFEPEESSTFLGYIAVARKMRAGKKRE